MKKHAACFLCLMLMLLFLPACSVRPQNMTVVLNDHTGSDGNSQQAAFQLQEASYQTIGWRAFAGWQKDQLLVYDADGAYLIDPSTDKKTVLFPTDNNILMFLTLSDDGQKTCYITIESEESLPTIFFADGNMKNAELAGYGGFSLNMTDSKWESLISSLQNSESFWSTGSQSVMLPGFYNWKSNSSYLLDLTMEDSAAMEPLYALGLDAKSLLLLDVCDARNEMLSYFFDGETITLYITNSQSYESFSPLVQYGNLEKASFLEENAIVYLSGDTMGIIRRDLPGQAKIYTGIGDYALSPDRSSLCFTKLNEDGSYDVYAAQYKDGIVLSETLVFKGFWPQKKCHPLFSGRQNHLHRRGKSFKTVLKI